MEKLKEKLNKLKKELKDERLKTFELNELYAVFPFNKFEYIISYLLSEKIITISDYETMREEYLERNRFLHLFEITAPRAFGEKWAQNHIRELVQELVKPSKKLDPNYNQAYDLFYQGANLNIRIEVKASRAVEKDKECSLVMKALPHNTKKRFDMNFQQLKPTECDVFIWIAVWIDKISYWVIPADVVRNHPNYSSNQHTQSKIRKPIEEGQLWITEKNIKSFDKYLTDPRELLEVVIMAYTKQKKLYNSD